MGVKEKVAPWGKQFIRSHMPDQLREFFENQPFLVVAARDPVDSSMWAALMDATDGDLGFIHSPDPTVLRIHSRPVPGDALTGALRPGSDLGILAIEFATKRRNRVNGRVYSHHPSDAAEYDGSAIGNGGESWMGGGDEESSKSDHIVSLLALVRRYQ